MFDYSKLDTPEALAHIFHPRPSLAREPVLGALNVDFAVDDGTTLACRFHLTSNTAPVILYFHGNGEVAADYDMIGPMYTEAGMNFLVTDFRGYGWSTGTPTVTNMLGDSRFLLRECVDWMARNQYTGPLFVMGRSLGSACAIELCCREKELIKGLIIESGFCDTLPLIKTLGIDTKGMDIREEECFNNRAKIAQVQLPTFILHGSRDSLIPAEEAEKLQATSGARSKEFQVIPGADHNTMIAVGGTGYFTAIKKFIDKVTGASSWRRCRKTFRK